MEQREVCGVGGVLSQVIEMTGREDYGFDLRNEASHRIARKIVESGILDETIPII